MQVWHAYPGSGCDIQWMGANKSNRGEPMSGFRIETSQSGRTFRISSFRNAPQERSDRRRPDM